MMNRSFPSFDDEAAFETRAALHAYSRVLGECLKIVRPKRKHWWHASLRTSLMGLSTGVIHGSTDFELEIDFRNSCLVMRAASGEIRSELLEGQPAYKVIDAVADFLASTNIDKDAKSHIKPDADTARTFDAYSAEQAHLMGRVFSDVAANMAEFRAGVREETSPIQVWPHHFDMSMLWLPGDKLPDQDPDNEEFADNQMNFGFTFGDEGIPEPYFYVTAYPLPAAFTTLDLPDGTTWNSAGFSGAVLTYRRLIEESDPSDYLQSLWQYLLAAGRQHLIAHSIKGT